MSAPSEEEERCRQGCKEASAVGAELGNGSQISVCQFSWHVMGTEVKIPSRERWPEHEQEGLQVNVATEHSNNDF